jgi:hypothetical protein
MSENTRTSFIWPLLLTIIGFGFAIWRYIQFSQAEYMPQLSRLELFVYRAGGKWAVIGVLLLMGVVGLVGTIQRLRER